MSEYERIMQPPDADSYVKLRTAAGLSERTRQAAEVGRAGAWFGVQVVHLDREVAMGRVIGEGGIRGPVTTESFAILPEQGR